MPKVTLTHVKNRSYFCSGFLSIGVYLHDTTALLIDSGGDENSAKEALNAVAEAGYSVTAIINTHCHPDHSGGNAFFQKKNPGIRIYAARAEQAFIEDPEVAPRCFCAGAAPFAALQTKHIRPQKESVVTDVITNYQDHTISIEGEQFKLITLPGHTPGSIGIITPDNILYAGDALFGLETVNKHPILFYTDIEKTRASLQKLATLNVDACVLYHGGVVKNLKELAELHQEKILAIKNTVLSFIQAQPLSVDQLTQQIMQKYTVPNNVVSYTLTQTAMRAYVTQLEKEKAVEIGVFDGLLQIKALS